MVNTMRLVRKRRGTNQRVTIPHAGIDRSIYLSDQWRESLDESIHKKEAIEDIIEKTRFLSSTYYDW